MTLQVFQMPFIFVQLCSSWQEFNWHRASRGPSTTAELIACICGYVKAAARCWHCSERWWSQKKPRVMWSDLS